MKPTDTFDFVARFRRTAWSVAGLAVFFTALWVLHRETSGIRIAEVLDHVRALPSASVLAAIGLTVASYAVLAGYDWLALRHVGQRLPVRVVALVSFVATAVGHNFGVAMLSGGAVRYRLYGAAGLSAAEIANVVGLVGLTFGLGLCFVSGLVLLFAVPGAVVVAGLSRLPAQLAGGALLSLLAAYVIWGAIRDTPLRVGDWQLSLPAPSTTAMQIGFAALDIALAAAVLYLLLPAEASVSYPHLLVVYVLAIGAGVISHVPAGLGVFESVLLLSLAEVPRDALLGGIVAYRVVYYLVPLVVAILLEVVQEVRLRHTAIAPGLRLINELLQRAAPQLLTVLVFVTGAVLVLSGATPALGARLEDLAVFLPLPVLELSHMAGSLTGLALMLLAYGLQRRVSEAYHLTVWLLGLGVAFSLAKGLDYEEALVSLLALGALVNGRKAFYRHAALRDIRPSPAWLVLVVMAVVGSIWLGLFAHRHVAYANELWWQFALLDNAPRFLRASLVMVIAGTAFALWRMLRPRPPEPELPDREVLQKAAAIVARSSHSDATLALVGDKRLLFSESGEGFVMYQVRGGSWVAMGDPVGPEPELDALAWRFRELVDYHGGRAIFYQVDAENLPVYVDMGMVLLKLGEEALIPLSAFTLDGPERADLRQGRRRAQRDGATFDLLRPDEVAPMIPALKSISDDWLASRNTREKRFALGSFESSYLQRCHCALVRVQGRPVAFANLWTGDGRSELSVDMMRYATGAPRSVMDYLFAEVLLWGSASGYGRFNLGMAPLSGLEAHPLAPMWHRLGTLVFRHGEHFYNFEGLRAYKQKFQPDWQPKYLAAPAGLALPTALLDIAALISGGLKGVFAR